MTLVPPRRIGSARIGERLGEGGMAFVHRAEDLALPGRFYAAKLLRPEVHHDGELVRRFLREGEVLTRIRHPFLVEVHAFGMAASWPYLMLELLPGGSVAACLGEPPGDVVQRLLGPMGGLALAHAHGIVHRDLKPSNLLFAHDGRLKVTDFGVCLWEGDEGTRLTRSRMVVGTLGFMAPEQHGDPRKVDARADIYALGALLYEFTTGRPYAQVMLPPASARPGFPPALARILMDALAPDPQRRIPTMALFQERMASWLETAEAVGWGSEPLHGPVARTEARTLARPRTAALDPPPAAVEEESRFRPYLDALASGSVGVRREIAQRLAIQVQAEDLPFLLGALQEVPDAARFAVVEALGRVGDASALDPLMDRLNDPYCQKEAAEATARIARRIGTSGRVLPRLAESGLGTPVRWTARAILGDPAWVEAVLGAWRGLGPVQQVQILEAARELPPEPRARIKAATSGAVGSARAHWEKL